CFARCQCTVDTAQNTFLGIPRALELVPIDEADVFLQLIQDHGRMPPQRSVHDCCKAQHPTTDERELRNRNVVAETPLENTTVEACPGLGANEARAAHELPAFRVELCQARKRLRLVARQELVISREHARLVRTPSVSSREPAVQLGPPLTRDGALQRLF